jgi:hypothetical protein
MERGLIAPIVRTKTDNQHHSLLFSSIELMGLIAENICQGANVKLFTYGPCKPSPKEKKRFLHNGLFYGPKLHFVGGQ